MSKIRIYFTPKGYKDIVCECVEIDGTLNTAIIIGGKEDGNVYSNCRGAKVIKFEVEENE